MKLTKKELKKFIYNSTMEVVGRLMESRLDDKRAKAAALEDIYKEMISDENDFQKRTPKGIDINGEHFDDSEKIRSHYNRAQNNRMRQISQIAKNASAPQRELLGKIDKLTRYLDTLERRRNSARTREEMNRIWEEKKDVQKQISVLQKKLHSMKNFSDNTMQNIQNDRRSSLNRFKEQRTAREQAFNDKRRSNREILQQLKDTEIESYD